MGTTLSNSKIRNPEFTVVNTCSPQPSVTHDVTMDSPHNPALGRGCRNSFFPEICFQHDEDYDISTTWFQVEGSFDDDDVKQGELRMLKCK